MINQNLNIDDLLKQLGERLKEARLNRNENQDLFAQRLGLTRQSYSKMEKGSRQTPFWANLEIGRTCWQTARICSLSSRRRAANGNEPEAADRGENDQTRRMDNFTQWRTTQGR